MSNSTYLLVDDDDSAHQRAIEDEPHEGAGDEVSHWTNDHVVLELVASAPDDRPRL